MQRKVKVIVNISGSGGMTREMVLPREAWRGEFRIGRNLLLRAIYVTRHNGIVEYYNNVLGAISYWEPNRSEWNLIGVKLGNLHDAGCNDAGVAFDAVSRALQ